METEKPAAKQHRTKYDAAFRTEAVRRVTQDGQAATRVAQALGISEAVLGKWVRAAAPKPPARQVAKSWSKKTSSYEPSWPGRRWSATF